LKAQRTGVDCWDQEDIAGSPSGSLLVET